MAQVMVNVCDKCLDTTRTATEWVITRPGTEEWWKVWLCNEHGAALEDLLATVEQEKPAPAKRTAAKKTAKKATRRAPAARGRGPVEVVTPQQLASLKAKGEA